MPGIGFVERTKKPLSNDKKIFIFQIVLVSVLTLLYVAVCIILQLFLSSYCSKWGPYDIIFGCLLLFPFPLLHVFFDRMALLVFTKISKEKINVKSARTIYIILTLLKYLVLGVPLLAGLLVNNLTGFLYFNVYVMLAGVLIIVITLISTTVFSNIITKKKS